ncbi:MAG TPA: RDD family protein [Mycobacteriales bacterium]|nr:RDD family protein [Mycobacteriales bacterium]
MPRWTGDWLSGPEHTLGELRDPATWPGARLGLPREGTGSVASFSARAAAFAVDLLASGMASGLINAFVQDPTGTQRQGAAYAVLALEHVLLVALTGRTLGMRVLSLRVVRLSDPTRVPGLVTAFLRTLPLLLTVGLTGFIARDGRGLHDVLAGSVVVRT